jgi:hypothetical protein
MIQKSRNKYAPPPPFLTGKNDRTHTPHAIALSVKVHSIAREVIGVDHSSLS